MSISISTYQVKKGDTLESVAKKLEISVEALKRYHNTYCELQNLIGHDLNGVHEIFIPPAEKIAELKETQKTIELTSQLPSVYVTESFYTPGYEVTERWEQQDKEEVAISYLVSLQLQKIIDKGFVAEVKTSGFRKDGQTPDDKISQLSQACMESISSFSFIVPVPGKIKGFHDHKSIVRKFENKRPDLESFFTGEVSQTYFNSFYTSLKNEGYLLKQFRSTLLYQVLFPEMDWFGRKKEWEEDFYLAVNSFPVKCRCKTGYHHDHPDTIEMIISGNSIEGFSLQELIRGAASEEIPEDSAAGEIEIKYTTDKVTKQLLRADATLILWQEGEVYRKHTVTLAGKKQEREMKNLVL